MATDKRTIGITKDNARVLERFVESGNFGSELDAAKFAMAYAISRDTSPGSTDGAETKWNVGSVDPDASLRSLVEALFPSTSEPYRLIEHLMNEGLRLLDAGGSPPPDIVEILFGDGKPNFGADTANG